MIDEMNTQGGDMQNQPTDGEQQDQTAATDTGTDAGQEGQADGADTEAAA